MLLIRLPSGRSWGRGLFSTASERSPAVGTIAVRAKAALRTGGGEA